MAHSFRRWAASWSLPLIIVSASNASPLIDANKVYDSGNYAEAEKAYRAILKTEPDNIFALRGLASSLRWQSGKSEEAQAVNDKVQNYKSSRSKNDEYGDAYFQSSDYKNAEPSYRDAIKEDPRDDWAWARLIDCLDAQGKTEEGSQAMLDWGKVKLGKTPAATPSNTTAAINASAATATVAPAGMSGWIAITEARGGNLVATCYKVSGSNVYQGIPNGAKSFAELQQRDPAHSGTVHTENGQMIFEFPGKPPLRVGGVIQKVVPMQAGRFEGKYVLSNSASFGGVNATGITTWTFHANGTVEHESVGAVETTAHHAGTGEHPAQALGASDNTAASSYTFSNGVMTLGDGSSHTVWNIGDKSPPWYLLIDGTVYTGQ